MTYTDYRAGDRVVCIDDDVLYSIKKGVEYTVESVAPLYVRLVGKIGGWYHYRFKLVSPPSPSELDKAIADAQAALDRVKALLSQRQ